MLLPIVFFTKCLRLISPTFINEHLFKNNLENANQWCQAEDVCIIDRGFRDSVEYLENQGYDRGLRDTVKYLEDQGYNVNMQFY